jgi:hypothetical protein
MTKTTMADVSEIPARRCIQLDFVVLIDSDLIVVHERAECVPQMRNMFALASGRAGAVLDAGARGYGY